ncbi:MAG: hypothetical protein II805_02485 [Candidatus Methanomethylophilus sp.]|jgi:rRNA processing protein Gar1|nr:hypothetical protein [Methanomethylophilus sp.]MBQ4411983.1 hypothetical protein [Methanomethylophilus sp.]MBQ5397046.1 hypothetical protein [Methanomethylophilus sp.]MBQ5483212.1 hypothetical protein [Methanomethylophilus sp.]
MEFHRLRGTMELLGIVEGITSEGHALVKCVSAPELGSAVFDKDRNRIGSVKRVLGPVDGPYASVSGDGVSGSLKGAKVYSGQGGNNGRNRGKGRKH